MLIKFNPSIAGYAGNNIGTNKNTQNQPAFKAITAEKAFNIGIKHNLPDNEAQHLIDMADAFKKYGDETLQSIKETANRKKGAFQLAIKELFHLNE